MQKTSSFDENPIFFTHSLHSYDLLSINHFYLDVQYSRGNIYDYLFEHYPMYIRLTTKTMLDLEYYTTTDWLHLFRSWCITPRYTFSSIQTTKLSNVRCTRTIKAKGVCPLYFILRTSKWGRWCFVCESCYALGRMPTYQRLGE